MPESEFFVTLVAAIGVAVAGGVVATRLGQSPIIGFVLGGIAIGPNTPGFAGDAAVVRALADVGIILLMFAIGVQLPARELLRVGPLAFLGAGAQVTLTIAAGFGIGLLLGWDWLPSLFLGAVLSNSSSTVIAKVLGDRGDLETRHGRLALAWSTVQDISTVVLVVLLSVLATDRDGGVADVILSIGRATLFLAVMVPFGFFVLPRLFAWVAALGSREVFVLCVAAVGLGTAYGASRFELSLALGAFVAGVVVAESDLSHRVLAEVMPVRDIFAALFFVSVGMLVEPVFVVENAPLVLLTLAVIVAGKGFISALIVALSGQTLRTAIITGVLLAQCAEFSFLMARTGADLEALSSDQFSLMLSASVLSIVLAPALFSRAPAGAAWAEARLGRPLLGPWGELRDDIPGGERIRGHAVVCGYGRVGRIIGAALRRRGFPFVVIEQDVHVVRRLRARGISAIPGNAGSEVLLERAGVQRAHVLVLATPDPVVNRQALDHGRRLNPELRIIARTHSGGERAYLESHGAAEAVLGELELALEMTRYTLRNFGLGPLEVQTLIQGLRERAAIEGGFESFGTRE